MAMFTHLSVFVKHKISIYQHGFVHGRSVETNLVFFLDSAGLATPSRSQLDTVYLDPSRAFDVASHELLINCSFTASVPAYARCLNTTCTFG